MNPLLSLIDTSFLPITMEDCSLVFPELHKQVISNHYILDLYDFIEDPGTCYWFEANPDDKPYHRYIYIYINPNERSILNFMNLSYKHTRQYAIGYIREFFMAQILHVLKRYSLIKNPVHTKKDVSYYIAYELDRFSFKYFMHNTSL